MDTLISASIVATVYKKWQEKKNLSMRDIRILFRHHLRVLIIHRDLLDARDYPEDVIVQQIIDSQGMYPPRIKNPNQNSLIKKKLGEIGGEPYKYVVPVSLSYIRRGSHQVCEGYKVMVGWYYTGNKTISVEVDSRKFKVHSGYTVFSLNEFLTPGEITAKIPTDSSLWGLFAHLPGSHLRSSLKRNWANNLDNHLKSCVKEW